MVVPEGMELEQEPSQAERPVWQDSLVDQARAKMLVRLHGIEASQQPGCAMLGVPLTAEVQLEGVPIKVMSDTGSPITIIALEYLLATLAKARSGAESLAQWQARVKDRLQPTSMQLRSYSGDEVPILKQIRVHFVGTPSLPRLGSKCKGMLP